MKITVHCAHPSRSHECKQQVEVGSTDQLIRWTMQMVNFEKKDDLIFATGKYNLSKQKVVHATNPRQGILKDGNDVVICNHKCRNYNTCKTFLAIAYQQKKRLNCRQCLAARKRQYQDKRKSNTPREASKKRKIPSTASGKVHTQKKNKTPRKPTRRPRSSAS